MSNPVKWLPIVGQIVDLGFWVADRVKSRRALKQAIKDADARRKNQAELSKRLDRIVTDAKKAK